jgi:hypothetical protein
LDFRYKNSKISNKADNGFLKKVSIAFTGVKSFIDALVVGEFELKSKGETALKVPKIRFFLHPEVWT